MPRGSGSFLDWIRGAGQPLRADYYMKYIFIIKQATTKTCYPLIPIGWSLAILCAMIWFMATVWGWLSLPLSGSLCSLLIHAGKLCHTGYGDLQIDWWLIPPMYGLAMCCDPELAIARAIASQDHQPDGPDYLARILIPAHLGPGPRKHIQ